MKLKEKLADEYAKAQLQIKPLQPFEDYYKTTNAYVEGFNKAMELVTDYIYEQTIEGTGDLERLGEEEVKNE